MDAKRKPTRKEQALATRRRVLAAAYKLFCEHGYAPTTMDAIAKAAGVAVQTLYFTFHTKGAILGEALGAAIIGFERYTPTPDDFDAARTPKAMAWWPSFDAESDGGKALGIFVDESLAIIRRVAPLLVAVNAAIGDADARTVVEVGERRRVDGYREVARALARKVPGFRAGVTLARATDLLLVFLGPALYQDLTAARGWSTSECKCFVNDALTHHLFSAGR
jgi:AcrR family transcriptional regulator